MIKRKHGTFVCVSSSGAAPYMGAYEVFKTAQGELASTIAAEVEDTGVYAFTIGPGIVKTPGFMEGGTQAAALMGKTLDELLEMNKKFLLTPEEAGAGFAAAIAQAEKFHGTEIGSIQALTSAGIEVAAPAEEIEPETSSKTIDRQKAQELLQPVLQTFIEQSDGWKSRNLFQRQWIFRDFKKETNMSVDEMKSQLERLGDNLEIGAPTARFKETLHKLHDYYTHQQEMLKGFEKIDKKRAEDQEIIENWKHQIKALLETF
jgi:hypothetical protein